MFLLLRDPDLLEKLSPVAGVSYDERGIQGSAECMPGTRVGVLAELMAWASDPESPPIYLLTGMAGAGKTAIARSFARLIDAEMFLGASFFCSRGTEGSSDAGRIIPSLAFHLAWHCEPYAQALISAIKMNPGTTFHLRPADFQFTTLLLRPSQAINQQVQVPIIIIDALDECSSIDAVRAVLTALIQSNGVRLKFFVTSRPEPHIEKAFHEEVVARHLRLRDVEHDIVTADITKYLSRNLHTIAEAIQAAGWPSDTDLRELVLRTGHLFIYAFTAIQYLSAKSLSRDEVQQRLQNIIYGTTPTKIQTAGIDTLYGQIVDNAWAGTEPDEKATRQKALTTLLCLREPLSLTAIAGLLEQTPDDLKTSLADFHSVLSVPASFQDSVIIFHASFPDYMTNGQRAGPNMLDVPIHHAVLALQCIKYMNLSLHQNLCNMNRADSYSLISEGAVNASIPSHLKYAATYWGTHLSLIAPGGANPSLISELHILSTNHILHWLECLSLIGKLHLAVDCLQKAILFISVRSTA
jgi:hypothetical protein